MVDEVELDTQSAAAEPTFQWPHPGEDWWLTKGATFRLDTDMIRFAACLHAIADPRLRSKNTQAARNAGLDWNRVEAFRAARSAGVAR